MSNFDLNDLKRLYLPSKTSHKGQNGRLMIIGGSHLFHGASLWALKVASRIVDMVFYSSVQENLELTKNLEKEIYDFIAVPRKKIEEYIVEADVVLIGPGMVRNSKFKIQNSKLQFKIQNLREIEDEGDQTYYLTKYLLQKYSNKKWVIDAGSLQMMDPEWLKWLNGRVVITPHKKEFEKLFSNVILSEAKNPRLHRYVKHCGQVDPSVISLSQDDIKKMAKEYRCTILLKGKEDIVCSSKECVQIAGGNEGMTKGGTGDVLAGLVAALTCKNDLFLAAEAGSFINKKAGEELYKRVGPFFNASDLCDEIPKVMKELLYMS